MTAERRPSSGVGKTFHAIRRIFRPKPESNCEIPVSEEDIHIGHQRASRPGEIQYAGRTATIIDGHNELKPAE